MGIIVHMAKYTEKQQFAREMALRIKGARKARRLSMLAMAEAIGEPYENYKKWEQGAAIMPHNVMPKFCTVAKVDPWHLLTGLHGGFEPDPSLLPCKPQKRA